MMMIVDYPTPTRNSARSWTISTKLGEEIGVRIRCQREEIFTKMHRV